MYGRISITAILPIESEIMSRNSCAGIVITLKKKCFTLLNRKGIAILDKI